MMIGRALFGKLALILFLITPGQGVIAGPCEGLCSPDWWAAASSERLGAEMNSVYVDALKSSDWKCSCANHYYVRDGWERTPMHVASLAPPTTEINYSKVVEIFSDHGLSLEVLDYAQKTALHTAAQYGRIEYVDALVAAGADLEAKDIGGASPLHGAAQHSTAEILTKLINLGADVNARDRKGHNALHFAAADLWRHDHLVIEKIELLLNKGHKLTDRAGETGYTALHMAALTGRLATVRYIMNKDKKLDVNSRDKEGDTPLHIAVKVTEIDRSKIMSALIAGGADVEARDKRGNSVLTVVAYTPQRFSADYMELLLEAGSNPNAENKTGNTAMHAAVWAGKTLEMKILKKYGADIDKKNEDGHSPLLAMVFSNKSPEPNVIGMLAKYGANIETTTRNGETVLHVAIDRGHLSLVDWMLQDTNPFRNLSKTQDIFNMTPLELAEDIGTLDGTRTFIKLKEATLLDDVIPWPQ